MYRDLLLSKCTDKPKLDSSDVENLRFRVLAEVPCIFNVVEKLPMNNCNNNNNNNNHNNNIEKQNRLNKVFVSFFIWEVLDEKILSEFC